MAALDTELAEIERLVQNVRIDDAEKRLRALFRTMEDEQLRAWEPDLRAVIKVFHRKRRRALDIDLDGELRRSEVAVRPKAQGQPEDAAEIVDAVREMLAGKLRDLSVNHIFQWATAYRDRLSEAFDVLFEFGVVGSPAQAGTVARTEIRAHTTEIFTKGYLHTSAQMGDRPFPIVKSLGGLQRLLDIPIELYSAKVSRGMGARDSRVLRQVTSGLIAGILEGFAAVGFGDDTGSRVLSRSPWSWAHTLAFVTGDDLEAILDPVEEGVLRDGLIQTVLPVLRTLDGFEDPDYFPLPALSQFVWDDRRLEIDLHPPSDADDPRLLEVECYLDAALVRERALHAAADRDAALIVAPIGNELWSVMAKDERVARLLVAASTGESTPAGVADACSEVLQDVLFRRRSAGEVDQPLRNNFAREFPINRPSLVRYYHVQRSSVRELLRAFERRNGVRLWCSIRRSGKTTACNDLAGSTGGTMVITQTCDSTGQIAEGSAFYDAVCNALAEGNQLKNSFFFDLVQQVAPASAASAERFVFVLDEYETLFGQLRWALRREPDLRYPVVQPLLNQMVLFARDHLLVFLGQQPNAHYILMDQNQLSPYIEQDPFPLFRHEDGQRNTEFTELVHKVLTSRVVLRPGFVDAVYDETGGHPYLTANVLTEFVEWMIDTDRRLGDLAVGPDDFRMFRDARLIAKRISMTPEYHFFRHASAEALSEAGRGQTPWLHAIYACLQSMCEGRGALGCSRREFAQIVRSRNLDALGFTAEHLLSSGYQANFLVFNHQRVWPRIRILGRIAAVTPPSVSV